MRRISLTPVLVALGFVAILALAAWLRLGRLDVFLFENDEAEWANAALSIARGRVLPPHRHSFARLRQHRPGLSLHARLTDATLARPRLHYRLRRAAEPGGRRATLPLHSPLLRPAAGLPGNRTLCHGALGSLPFPQDLEPQRPAAVYPRLLLVALPGGHRPPAALSHSRGRRLRHRRPAEPGRAGAGAHPGCLRRALPATARPGLAGGSGRRRDPADGVVPVLRIHPRL